MSTKNLLKINDQAPDFSLENAQGETISLSAFKDQWVILYFYPRDNTPGCTVEAIDFSTLLPQFKKQKALIFGVSKDNLKSHCKFIEKQNLKIELLSDPDHKVQELYGVWRTKKFMGREFLGTVRSTFLISPGKTIIKIWDPVSVKGHAEEVLDELTKAQKAR